MCITYATGLSEIESAELDCLPDIVTSSSGSELKQIASRVVSGVTPQDEATGD